MKHLSGGSGNRGVEIALMHGGLLVNDTNKAYEVNYGYSTTANGRAGEIVLAPGECARRTSKGSAHDFARWQVGSRNEFPADLEEFPVSHCEKWR